MHLSLLPFYTNTADQEFRNAVRDTMRGKSTLLHGTSLGSMIVRTDTLLYPHVGEPKISFTRSPETAVHFATLPKDFDDGLPTVFVLDRHSLRFRHKIEPHQDPAPDSHTFGKFEMEERIWQRDVRPVSQHLRAIVFGFGHHIFTLTSTAEFRKVYLPIAVFCAAESIHIRSNHKAP